MGRGAYRLERGFDEFRCKRRDDGVPVSSEEHDAPWLTCDKREAGPKRSGWIHFCESERKRPARDPSEEVALSEASEFIGFDFGD